MSPKPQETSESIEMGTPPSEQALSNEEHHHVDRPGFHIPTNEEEEHHVEELHGHDDWRSKTLHIVHSKPVTFFLLSLLLLDVIILFAELYIGAEYPSCKIIERDAISCCDAPQNAEQNAEHRWLKEIPEITESGFGDWESIPTDEDWRRAVAEEEHADEGHVDGTHADDSHADDSHLDDSHGQDDSNVVSLAHGHGDHHSYCENGLTDMPPSKYPAACNPHKYTAIHTAHEALFWTTVVILCIFLVELTILIICLGCSFFTNVFYVLDLVVVATSLALELTFHIFDENALSIVVGLLILARLWRFVRIGHGLVEATNEFASHKHGRLVKYIDQLESVLKENNIELPDRKSIRDLKLLDPENH